MITREQILATIDDHADELRDLGAKSLALFGSMARGEGSASSPLSPGQQIFTDDIGHSNFAQI